jgi:DNA-binding LytR/AlgR family response regulator
MSSMMSAREIQIQKAVPRKTSAQRVAVASIDISARPLPGAVSSQRAGQPHTIKSTVEEICETGDTSFLSLLRGDPANLARILRQLDDIGRRQVPRIAFKAKGSILLVDVCDIVALKAEGNYVSLHHRLNPYLVHESLSSLAEKLKPYGFIRIHRSIVVNVSAVEELQPLPTGEYRLRVKGGKEYVVTRTYKHNLRGLAQLWIGSERLCG